MPIGISAALSAAPSVFQFIKGLGQEDKADQLAQTPRPVYKRPGEIDEYLNQARTLAGQSRFIGQDRAEENVGQNLATGINAATQAGNSSSGILATLNGLDNNANQADQAIAEKGLEYQERNKQHLGDALQTSAGYADKEFDYNKNQPYQTAMQAAARLQAKGEQNQFGAMTNAATALSGLFGGGNSKLINSIFGGSSPSSTTAPSFNPVNDTAPALNISGSSPWTMQNSTPPATPQPDMPQYSMTGDPNEATSNVSGGIGAMGSNSTQTGTPMDQQSIVASLKSQYPNMSDSDIARMLLQLRGQTNLINPQI